ncbi:MULTISPECIES: hypothetical protein [Bacillus cereus group]|uniref:PXO1-76 n=1 Tax=Bacillus thuringiensis TaxID=1428 RepID=A0A1C4E8P4_BACTU|nr:MULTISPECIES: hypothetical protein [Bacillus cereus group]MED3022610.1 hypothetical protein [Bacillus wiedmannii]OTY00525.1 hypothetical protein BK729_09760 [Bacillus thuringiensis serovar wratislaviensis]OUB61916.1 hypothetical protein BK743_07275 [Bacillus thuringiensis serovar sylvestriensis]SCC39989.1 Uncharacterized protein BTT61001_02970 [Bacillus thuringiensis]
MLEMIYFAAIAIVGFFFYRKMNEKPLFGSKKKGKKQGGVEKHTAEKSGKKNKKNMPAESEVDEDNVDFFNAFVEDIKEIDNHMIRYHDDTFVLIAEAHPVNYYLLSNMEQEAIDIKIESWLTTLEFNTKVYIQSKFVDLTDPVRKMTETMKGAKDLTPETVLYGQEVIDNLEYWQRSQPRYEQKRYLIYPYKVDISTITADTEEELEEKIVDKAFNELYRRYNASRNLLSKAKINVEMLTKEKLIELLYVAFNRRKAVKARFQDLIENENFSLYSTSETNERKLELLKKVLAGEKTEKSNNRVA